MGYPYPPPGRPAHSARRRPGNRALLACGIAAVAVLLLMLSCGVGAAIGADPAATSRPTTTRTATETVTVTEEVTESATVTVTAHVTAPPTSRRPSPRRTTRRPAPVPAPHTDPRFGTCREANAAGYGPYRRGLDPEYDWYDDRDHDGVVCETR